MEGDAFLADAGGAGLNGVSSTILMTQKSQQLPSQRPVTSAAANARGTSNNRASGKMLKDKARGLHSKSRGVSGLVIDPVLGPVI
jgi:hypothetical protein